MAADKKDKITIRRILMALEPAEADRDLFENTARLASGLNAELVARMFADIDPGEFEQLPFLRVTNAGGQVRSIERMSMRRALHRVRERHRKLLEETAGRARIQAAFEDRPPGTDIDWQREVKHFDLVTVVQTGVRGSGMFQAFRDLDLACRSTTCAVLDLRHAMPAGRPVLIDYAGGVHVLKMAVDFSRVFDTDLIIARSADEKEELESVLSGLSLGDSQRADIRIVETNDDSDLRKLIENRRPALLVISRSGGLLPPGEARRLGDRLRCPILIVP